MWFTTPHSPTLGTVYTNVTEVMVTCSVDFLFLAKINFLYFFTFTSG